jgi:hypothetical protein
MVFQVASALVLTFLTVAEYAHAGEGQPPQTDSIGQFKVVGNSLVSAQQASQVLSVLSAFFNCTIRHFSVPPTRYTSSTKPKITLNRLMDIRLGRLVCPYFIHRGDRLPDCLRRMVGESVEGTANGHCHQQFLRGASAHYVQLLAPIPIISQGGNVLGNGTWLNVGGNQAVQYGGNPAQSQTGGEPYDDPDGGKSWVLPMSTLFKLI